MQNIQKSRNKNVNGIKLGENTGDTDTMNSQLQIEAHIPLLSKPTKRKHNTTFKSTESPGLLYLPFNVLLHPNPNECLFHSFIHLIEVYLVSFLVNFLGTHLVIEQWLRFVNYVLSKRIIKYYTKEQRFATIPFRIQCVKRITSIKASYLFLYTKIQYRMYFRVLVNIHTYHIGKYILYNM